MYNDILTFIYKYINTKNVSIYLNLYILPFYQKLNAFFSKPLFFYLYYSPAVNEQHEGDNTMDKKNA